MTGMNSIVPSRSWAEIAGIADSVRTAFGLGDTPFLTIIPLLELLPDVLENFELRILPDEEMEGVMGITCPQGSYISLPESVYGRACHNHGRDRFTCAHELGHLVLHKGTTFQRAEVHNHPAYMLSEPQANLFASIILMPRKFIEPSYTAEDMTDIFGVSLEAATIRLHTLAKRHI